MMIMKICPANDFVVLLLIVVVLALSGDILRTCQAERTVTVSTRVGLTEQNQTTCDTANTLSALENFDNFTWWNLQLQFPVDLVDSGGIAFTNFGAATKENGFVQAVGNPEIVVLNWTIADTPQSFILQWIYNDGIVWDSHEFCQVRRGGGDIGVAMAILLRIRASIVSKVGINMAFVFTN
jgi:hypothetical protein